MEYQDRKQNEGKNEKKQPRKGKGCIRTSVGEVEMDRNQTVEYKRYQTLKVK